MSEYLCLLTTSKRRQTDMGLYRSSSHVYWRCKYHIVWTPKYRFRILRDKLGKELYRTIYILCGIKDCEVLELNVQPDHVHLVVIVPPKISISTLMGHLKGRSAIRLYGVSLDIENYCTLRLFFGHCCKVSDEAAFCLIQRPYISKTLLTRRISPRGSP